METPTEIGVFSLVPVWICVNFVILQCFGTNEDVFVSITFLLVNLTQFFSQCCVKMHFSKSFDTISVSFVLQKVLLTQISQNICVNSSYFAAIDTNQKFFVSKSLKTSLLTQPKPLYGMICS